MAIIFGFVKNWPGVGGNASSVLPIFSKTDLLPGQIQNTPKVQAFRKEWLWHLRGKKEKILSKTKLKTFFEGS